MLFEIAAYREKNGTGEIPSTYIFGDGEPVGSGYTVRSARGATATSRPTSKLSSNFSEFRRLLGRADHVLPGECFLRGRLRPWRIEHLDRGKQCRNRGGDEDVLGVDSHSEIVDCCHALHPSQVREPPTDPE